MRRQYDCDHPDMSTRHSKSSYSFEEESASANTHTANGILSSLHMPSYSFARDIVVEIGTNFHIVLYLVALFGYCGYWLQIAAIAWLAIAVVANILMHRRRLARMVVKSATSCVAESLNARPIIADNALFSYIPAVLIFLAVLGAFGFWIQWGALVWLVIAVAVGPGFDPDWKKLGEVQASVVEVVETIYERMGTAACIQSKEVDDTPPPAPPSIIITSATVVSLASTVGEEEPAWR